MSSGDRSSRPFPLKLEGQRRTLAVWCLLLTLVVMRPVRGESEVASVPSGPGHAKEGDLQDAQTQESTPELQGTIRDLVFFGVKRHLVIRFEVFIDEQPLDKRYAESIEQSFDYWDSNSDDQLSDEETSGAPWRNKVMRNLSSSLLNSLLKASGSKIADHGQSRDSYQRAYRRRNKPIQIVGPVGMTSPEQPIFDRLDVNRDSNLSAPELRDASASLSILDINDDGIVARTELGQYDNPFAGQRFGNTANAMQGSALTSGTDQARFVWLTDEAVKSRVAKRIRKKYAERSEVSDDEVLKPDLTVRAKLGKRDGTTKSLELIEPQDGLGGLRVHVNRLGAIVVDTKDERLSLHGEDANNSQWEENYKQNFKSADGDNNGYLDKSESRYSGLFFQNFELMDRNRDGKLFEQEVLDAARLQVVEAHSRAQLDVRTTGRQLFEFIDLDGDARLSAREKRDFAARLDSWDRNGDGQINNHEVPEYYRIDVRLGRVAMNPYMFIAGSRSAPNQVSMDKMPNWFVRLDRNRDGDVSKNEFIGPVRIFQSMDTDQDGLIGSDEALSAAQEK